MTFETPDDLDFSSWERPLAEKIRKYCPHGEMKFSKTPMALGTSVFSQLASGDAQEALRGLLKQGNVGPYLAARWGHMLLFALGFLLLLIAIGASCGIVEKVRRKYSQWFCGHCRPRARPRFKNVKPRYRSILCVSSVVLGTCTTALAIFAIIATTQVLDGFKSSECAVWLQMYGHYFGADGIDSHEIPEIAHSWSGSSKLRSDISALGPRLIPSEDNPMYVDLRQKKAAVFQEAHRLSSFMDDMGTNAKNLADFHFQFMNDAWGSIPKADRGKRKAPNLAVYTVLKLKADKLANLTADLLAQGSVLIDEKLEQYSGPNSTLMNKGYQSVADSLETIEQIDASLAVLVRLWDKMGGLLAALMYTLVVLGYMFAIAVVLLVLLNLILAFMLLKHLRVDHFLEKPERIAWKTLYTGYSVCAGLGLFLSAMYLLTGGVGSDTCHIAQYDLLTDGDWSFLSQEVFTPLPDRHTIDFRSVLDTCVRKDGNGNVAVSMALDGRIAELSEDVDGAKDDIIASQDNLVQRAEQIGRIQNLGLAYQEVLRSHLQDDVREDSAPRSIPQPVFADYRMVNFDEKHEAYQGQNTFMCFLPTMTIMPCTSRGLWYSVASPNDAYDYLNRVARAIHDQDSTNASSIFPTHFCGYIGARTGTCGMESATSNGVWLDHSLTDKNITAWTDSIPEDTTFEHYTDYVRDRTRFLIRTLWLNEMMANYTTKSTNPLTSCPSEGCTYDLWRRQDITVFESYRDLTATNITALLKLFDDFLAVDVLPQMDSLVNDANALTEAANCQFEGTALRYGAIDALCTNMFPGSLFGSIMFGLLSVFLLVLAIHSWHWVTYIVDLVNAFNKSASGYETPAFVSMAKRPEFVSYTGLPPLRHRNGKSFVDNHPLENTPPYVEPPLPHHGAPLDSHASTPGIYPSCNEIEERKSSLATSSSFNTIGRSHSLLAVNQLSTPNTQSVSAHQLKDSRPSGDYTITFNEEAHEEPAATINDWEQHRPTAAFPMVIDHESISGDEIFTSRTNPSEVE